jgi:uroporphyrin-III C-methyltransferase
MLHDGVGSVKLVGAGPGAADLLTVRAVRAIQSADVLLVDALVSAEIRELIPARVRVVEVGKRGHRPSTPQDFINRLMVRLARSGAKIVRLKSGDPSVFGRAGEERAFLEAAGVKVEVIAGVTTASAAAAQFGFSLTERGVARRILFATGRTLGGPECDWRSAADAQTTLCLYMGCADIERICVALVAAGRDALTPAAVLIDVERPEARMIRSTLGGLPCAIDGSEGATAMIVIGEVCASTLKRELDNRRYVITRRGA